LNNVLVLNIHRNETKSLGLFHVARQFVALYSFRTALFGHF
jgi:hypothetical protein